MPSDAAMTVAVVQAMPFVVNTRLYGARVAGEAAAQVLRARRRRGRRR